MITTPKSTNKTPASMLLHNFLKDCKKKANEAASRRQSHRAKRARLTEEDEFAPVHDESYDGQSTSAQAASRRQSHRPTRARLTEEEDFAPVHDESYDGPSPSLCSVEQLSPHNTITFI
uniref:Uncharacterized protein n=1 Tax=Glossina palpalis gambiensis TaxID=67801 RepID=A0A1B0ATU5_9MUSC